MAFEECFGLVAAQAYIAPVKGSVDGGGPWAAVNLGSRGNESKRVSAHFRTGTMNELRARIRTLLVDPRAGGEEALRVPPPAPPGSGTCAASGKVVSAVFASIIAPRAIFYLILPVNGLGAGSPTAPAAGRLGGTPAGVYFAGGVSQTLSGCRGRPPGPGAV